VDKAAAAADKAVEDKATLALVAAVAVEDIDRTEDMEPGSDRPRSGLPYMEAGDTNLGRGASIRKAGLSPNLMMKMKMKMKMMNRKNPKSIRHKMATQVLELVSALALVWVDKYRDRGSNHNHQSRCFHKETPSRIHHRPELVEDTPLGKERNRKAAHKADSTNNHRMAAELELASASVSV